jgi:hypothetical protein
MQAGLSRILGAFALASAYLVMAGLDMAIQAELLEIRADFIQARGF